MLLLLMSSNCSDELEVNAGKFVNRLLDAYTANKLAILSNTPSSIISRTLSSRCL